MSEYNYLSRREFLKLSGLFALLLVPQRKLHRKNQTSKCIIADKGLAFNGTASFNGSWKFAKTPIHKYYFPFFNNGV